MSNVGNEDRAVAVPRDDPDIYQATLTARRTLEEFIRRIGSPAATQQYQAVKVKMMNQVGSDEYFWIPVATFDQGSFLVGANEHRNSSALLSANYPTSIGSDEIYDWMIVDDGILVGGYSLRVMRAKMDPEQRRQFEKLTWYKFEKD